MMNQVVVVPTDKTKKKKLLGYFVSGEPEDSLWLKFYTERER